MEVIIITLSYDEDKSRAEPDGIKLFMLIWFFKFVLHFYIFIRKCWTKHKSGQIFASACFHSYPLSSSKIKAEALNGTKVQNFWVKIRWMKMELTIITIELLLMLLLIPIIIIIFLPLFACVCVFLKGKWKNDKWFSSLTVTIIIHAISSALIHTKIYAILLFLLIILLESNLNYESIACGIMAVIYMNKIDYTLHSAGLSAIEWSKLQK